MKQKKEKTKRKEKTFIVGSPIPTGIEGEYSKPCKLCGSLCYFSDKHKNIKGDYICFECFRKVQEPKIIIETETLKHVNELLETKLSKKDLKDMILFLKDLDEKRVAM